MFVSRQVITRAFEIAIARNRRGLRQASIQLRNGEISLRQWQREVATRLKDSHLYAAAIARGGKLSQADYGRIGRLVRDRYAYLARFGADIASGAQPLNGRFLNRAEAYVLHARQARHEAERIEMLEVQGLGFEENRLGAADHCESGDRIGCIEASAMGRVPIGTLPLVGTRSCLYQCKCQIVYS